jgi:hypothetical protein
MALMVSNRARRVSPRQEGDEVLVDNLDAGKLSARYDRGVLILTIPIAKTSKSRRITLSRHGDTLQDNGSAGADQASDQQPAATTSQETKE